jgi:hypothetical protein
MAAALSNELGMMENQLSRSKDAASEALALREQAESLTSLVAKKVYIQSGRAFLLHLYFLYSAYVKLFCNLTHACECCFKAYPMGSLLPMH